MTREQYLADARVKRGFNQAMNMREISAAYGIAYGKVRRMALEQDFPMSRGIVFPKDFERWLAKGRRPRAGEGRRQSAAGTARERGSRNGSPVSLPRTEGSRLFSDLSHALRGGSETYA
jgi:hypothetical protein